MESSFRKRVVASSWSTRLSECSIRTSSGRLSSLILRAGSGSAPTSLCEEVLVPPDGSRRRFCKQSSFLSLRICTVVASRLRRLSSWSIPFFIPLRCCGSFDDIIRCSGGRLS